MANKMNIPTLRHGCSRRRFLHNMLGGVAGLSGILALRQPPAVFAQKREISVLTTANFVPASDKKL
jgi:hypothetical protein